MKIFGLPNAKANDAAQEMAARIIAALEDDLRYVEDRPVLRRVTRQSIATAKRAAGWSL